jgi:hypothetical protein
MHVYRGEALLRAGRVDDALAALRLAVTESPSRTGAWLLLALAADRTGDEVEARRARIEAHRRAQPLVDDVAEELGRAPAMRDAPDAARARELFPRALARMRGNRSSGYATWFDRDGRLRSLPVAPLFEGEEDAAALREVAQWLARELAARRGRRS